MKDRLRVALFDRCNGLCEARTRKCTGRAEHWHHRLMRSQGGTDSLDNALAVCGACHNHIHENPTESYRRGWLIRSAA